MKFASANVKTPSPEQLHALQAADPYGSRIIERNRQARAAPPQAVQPTLPSQDEACNNKQHEKLMR